MFLDDDDDVEPQLKVVDNYHFEVNKDMVVSFSVLPFRFDDNEEVADPNSEKDVYLHGLADNGLHTVYKNVVAWTLGLDSDQPEVSVLSSEGNWIGLLKPRKYYEETVRTILITVQMLHFLRRRPTVSWKTLWDYLHEVFKKYDAGPAEDDFKEHHSLIKLFAERDLILAKSKILQGFIEDTSMKKSDEVILNNMGIKQKFIVDDDDYNYNEDSDDSSRATDIHGDNNDIDIGDGGGDDDGTDSVCAICDNGGKLLGCKGLCRRSFHPKKIDGKHSKCATLQYTRAQVQAIKNYLCMNCEYKQHQCFVCRELEPSGEPNAKVFLCNSAYCGHFYHPKCVAPLLLPNDTDGASELAKRIAAGMSFTCPVHWCFTCKSLEDPTQEALQLAACRRCTRSYHRKCLPREISFQREGIITRAWELSGRIFMYCLGHVIDTDIGTPSRDHIKFPCVPKIGKTGDSSKKKVRVNDKKKKRTFDGSHGDQPRKNSAKLSEKLSTKKSEQAQCVVTNSSLELIVLEPEGEAKHLKEDPHDPSTIEAAATASNPETLEEQEKQETTLAEKETSSKILQDICRKCIMPSTHAYSGRRINKFTHSMFECSVQIADKLRWYVQPGDMIVDFCCTANDFSQLMKEKLDEVGKKCNFKNFDLIQRKNDFCFEEWEWMVLQPNKLPRGSKLILVLNLPLGVEVVLANKLIDKAMTFKPKLIIVVCPRETERLDRKDEPYDLIWEYNQNLSGKSFYQAGSMDVDDKQKDDWYASHPCLHLWSHPDRSQEQKKIAEKHGHVSVEHNTFHTDQAEDDRLDNLLAEKHVEGDELNLRSGKERGGRKGESANKQCSIQGKEREIPKHGTFYADLEEGSRLNNLFVEKHDEGDGRNMRSAKEKHAFGVESAYELDSMSVKENPESDTSHNNQEEDNKLCNLFVKKHTEGVGPASGVESACEPDSILGKENLESDTFHTNQEEDNKLENLFMEKNAEAAEQNLRSGKARDTHRGESACKRDLVSRKVREISERDTSEKASSCKQGSISGNEKDIPENESKNSDARNKGWMPDKGGRYMETKAIQSRKNTQQECGQVGHREDGGSYACQEDLESPQHNKNRKTVDTSGNNSRKRRESKERTDDGTEKDFGINSRNSHRKDRRDTCCEDQRATWPHYYKSPVRHDNNNKEREVADYKHGKRGESMQAKETNNDHRSPWHVINGNAVFVPDYNSRKRRHSKRTAEAADNRKVDSDRGSSPPHGRNDRKRSMDHSPEHFLKVRMGRHNSYPRTNKGHKYPRGHSFDFYTRGGSGSSRRRHSPRHSPAFTTADSGGTTGSYSPRRHSASFHDDAYGRSRRHSSAFRDAYSSCGAGGNCYMSHPEHGFPDYAMNRRNFHDDYGEPQPDIRMGEHTTNYGGHVRDHHPQTSRMHSVVDDQVHSQSRDHHQRNRDHQGASGARYGLPTFSMARGSVTKRYIARLDETNYLINVRGSYAAGSPSGPYDYAPPLETMNAPRWQQSRPPW